VILYEDDHILVLNKPSGTAVHGGSGLSFGVIEGLRALRPEARFLELVHRLDRDTSGVLLVAKKRSALRSLHEQLRDKGMQKDYLALVRGQWQSHVKVVQAPLLKNILQSGERIVRVSQEGKPSETRFKVEERYEFATLVRCSPVTGRTHQIRVHTQYAGHPIAFDDRYGDREFDKQLAGTGLSRLFLHAAALKFTHPGSGEVMRIEAPLDEQLKRCLKVLRGRANKRNGGISCRRFLPQPQQRIKLLGATSDTAQSAVTRPACSDRGLPVFEQRNPQPFAFKTPGAVQRVLFAHIA
jgi:23S rRNA pseudouridine955/2504/2580 synthase